MGRIDGIGLRAAVISAYGEQDGFSRVPDHHAIGSAADQTGIQIQRQRSVHVEIHPGCGIHCEGQRFPGRELGFIRAEVVVKALFCEASHKHVGTVLLSYRTAVAIEPACGIENIVLSRVGYFRSGGVRIYHLQNHMVTQYS
ncbi:hypothetical protein SDC9_94563 [bioreactor metagenome]|uniref:Uncharacterized protein n=1 Tax=bioreactor metagenome TaxID=1076179 RepID=A0A645A452_9ZZZZ